MGSADRRRESWGNSGITRANSGGIPGEFRGIGKAGDMTPARTGGPPPIRIEAESERAWCGDQRLDLMPRAFAVLRHLVEHAGRLITKDEFFASVWRDVTVSDAAL